MEENAPEQAPDKEPAAESGAAPEAPSTSVDWKRHFTTETTLSKWLSIVLFIALPFLGFWLGTQIDPGYGLSKADSNGASEQAVPAEEMGNEAAAPAESEAPEEVDEATEEEPVIDLVPWATYVEPEPEPIVEEPATTTEEMAEDDEEEEDEDERDLFAPLPDATSTPETGTTTEESA